MSGTNQFIGMIAVFATVLLYTYNKSLMFGYSALYGLVALLGTATGLKAINKYIQRSGRQSVIAFILGALITNAFVQMPIYYWLRARIGAWGL